MFKQSLLIFFFILLYSICEAFPSKNSYTVIINHANNEKKAFYYIGYLGEPRVGSFKNDTLKILNDKGIVAYVNLGTKSNSYYLTLYAGDTIEVLSENGLDIIKSKNTALQSKIDLMLELLPNMRNKKNDRKVNFQNELKIIDSSYNVCKAIIDTYKDKVTRETFKEAHEICNFNRIDSIVSLHIFFNIKNDSLFKIPDSGNFAWNYMAFGHLSYRYTDFIRKVYKVNSSSKMFKFMQNHFTFKFKETVIFNFLNIFDHSTPPKVDTMHRLVNSFILFSQNETYKDYILTKINSYLGVKQAQGINKIMVIDSKGIAIPFESMLGKFKGNVLFLDFWATWCVPCLIEIPESQKLQSINKNIVVLYLSQDDDFQAWKDKSADMNIPPDRTFLFQKNNAFKKFIKKYQIYTIPRYMIISREGLIKKAKALLPSNPMLEKELLSISSD